MKINGKHYHTIWLEEEKGAPVTYIIDQRQLPHEFRIVGLRQLEDFTIAIRDMLVRGAPLIGSTAAYGLYTALWHAPDDKRKLEEYIHESAHKLKATRPTAVNLAYAVGRILQDITKAETIEEKTQIALETAHAITEESIRHCQAIGEHGLELIRKAAGSKKKGEPVNILTHCNAGWLACIDYGTATAPIYAAHNAGIPVHVWVDETRPRNQGARLTAYELLQQGVPHTIIADNTGGHLMQHGMVDMAIVGSDRTTLQGDVANKIGTYLKALAAKDNEVPFYVALPSSTFDWSIRDGLADIPIEERNAKEIKYMNGWHNGKAHSVLITPAESAAANYAFDVTPARLVSGLITERGVCSASEEGIKELFPEEERDVGTSESLNV